MTGREDRALSSSCRFKGEARRGMGSKWRAKPARLYVFNPERNIPAYKPGLEPSIQTAPTAFA